MDAGNYCICLILLTSIIRSDYDPDLGICVPGLTLNTLHHHGLSEDLGFWLTLTVISGYVCLLYLGSVGQGPS